MRFRQFRSIRLGRFAAIQDTPLASPPLFADTLDFLLMPPFRADGAAIIAAVVFFFFFFFRVFDAAFDAASRITERLSALSRRTML